MRLASMLAALVIVVAAAFLASCKGPVCIVADRAVTVATAALVTQLECKNSVAIREDLENIVKGLGICPGTATMKGPIADTVCPLVSRWAADKLLDVAIPADWECKAGAAKEKAVVIIETACKKIPL